MSNEESLACPIRGTLPRPAYQQRAFYQRAHVTTAAIKRICATPDATLRGLRDRALLELFVSTGVWVTSLATLKVAQLDLAGEAWALRVFDDATSTLCAIPINNIAHLHLLLWLNARPVPSPFVFTAFVGRSQRLTDRPLSQTAVWQLIQQYANKASFSTITPHDIQRFAIAQLAS